METKHRAESLEIRYFDSLTIRHKDSKQYLHSHEDKYPLRYDDGRISSQGMLHLADLQASR